MDSAKASTVSTSTPRSAARRRTSPSMFGAGSTATMRRAIPANPRPVCPAPLATSQTLSTCGRSAWSRSRVGLLVWTSLVA